MRVNPYELLALAVIVAASASCAEPMPQTEQGTGQDGGSTVPASGAPSDAAFAKPDAATNDELVDAAGQDAGESAGSSPDATAPPTDPVPCEAIAGANAEISFSPSEPWVGGAPRIRVDSPVAHTNVEIHAQGPGAPASVSFVSVEGGPSGPYTWLWNATVTEPGEACIELVADPNAMVVQRRRWNVLETAPPIAPFKVVRNHQWTCEEEYTWAINVDVRVEDENQVGIPGARVIVDHPPCDLRGATPPPAELVMDADGNARFENYYPRCFFHLRVADGPSDTAIEIYTGIWETQLDENGAECNYCSTFAENVWGHWSYSVVFRRTPGSAELCEVPTDHGGQASCSPLRHWEEPGGPCVGL